MYSSNADKLGIGKSDMGTNCSYCTDAIGIQRFAVLIFQNFPMMAFSAVLEPLRAANLLASRKLYEWLTVSGDGGTVAASNGISITPDHSAESAPNCDYIVVCSGGDADRLTEQRPLTWIRRSLREGANIGSVADGAFYLARAGLLDGYACTLHWTSEPAFAEAFPQVRLEQQLYVIDRTRFTSAGGVGAFDMMLEIIAGHQGEELSRQVAKWFVHDRIRADADRQRLQLRVRTSIRNNLVLDAVALMEDSIELGGSVSTIAGRLGISLGKLERCFKAELSVGPSDYYRRLRMQRARDLLEHSSMSVREIGLACGYQSFPAFVRAFRKTYDQTPRKLRG